VGSRADNCDVDEGSVRRLTLSSLTHHLAPSALCAAYCMLSARAERVVFYNYDFDTDGGQSWSRMTTSGATGAPWLAATPSPMTSKD
jgi:hypothetical protein